MLLRRRRQTVDHPKLNLKPSVKLELEGYGFAHDSGCERVARPPGASGVRRARGVRTGAERPPPAGRRPRGASVWTHVSPRARAYPRLLSVSST